jgi:predicted Zn finger-like uncharacterized protein
MYTQCPKCNSIFRITVGHLSARHGLARCGQCQEVFNASWNLVDSVPAAGDGEQGRPTLPGNSASAPTPVSAAHAGAPAGGEQVELFGTETVISAARPGRKSRVRGDAARSGAAPAVPSAMPFSVVMDDDTETPDHSHQVDAAAGEDGEQSPQLPSDRTDSPAATSVDDRPTDADGGVRAGVETQRPVAKDDMDLESIEHDASPQGPITAEPDDRAPAGEIAPADDDRLDTTAGPTEARAGDDTSKAEADGVGIEREDVESPPAADVEWEALPSEHMHDDGTQPPPDAEPAVQGHDRTGPAAEDAAEPSLAALFAAAEEPLPTADEAPPSGDAPATEPAIRDLFTAKHETPAPEHGGESDAAEELSEPEQSPPTSTDGEAASPDRAARSSTPFDTPDAEEIIIEAPPMLWNAFDDDTPSVRHDTDTTRGERGAGYDDRGDLADTDEYPAGAGRRSQADFEPVAAAYTGGVSGIGTQSRDGSMSGPPRPKRRWWRRSETRQSSTPSRGTRIRQSKDIRLVHIPRPQPLKTAAWILAAFVLVGGTLWQAKTYYLGSLSQVSALRPHLDSLCDIFSCSIPPRRAFNLIDLVGTSVNTHPETPGALRVSVNLVNQADFEQAYPPLEITLSDKNGRVVGRRTYLPEEYLADGASLLVPKVVQEVDLDLAQPSENAVGYEIQLVAQ